MRAGTRTCACACARACAWRWFVVLLLALTTLAPPRPCSAFLTLRHDQDQQEQQEQGQQQQASMSHLLEAINRVSQALETHERHTSLYERVALLEASLAEKTERAMALQAEVVQLRAKIPELEAEIETIPEMRKELAEFEANIEKLVHDYEAKLSTLASEVIRLKKHGARRKNLQTLSDGSNVLLRPAPACPEVGQGMVAERVGEQCLYFSLAAARNWTAAHHHCQTLRGEMAAPPDLHLLISFLRQSFAARGPSLWLGSSYNLSDEDTDEDEGEGEDEAASRFIAKLPEPDNEASSVTPPRQDPSDALQADGVIGFPEEGFVGPSNPFTLHLKEGPGLEVEEEVLGPADSLRGMLDQVPMFRDDLLARYGSLSLADEPVEPPQQPDEEAAGSSVVDIVLLTGSKGHQDTEPHAPSNQTVISGHESITGVLQEAVVGSGDGGSVEEAAGSTQEAEKGKESHKGRMKCMLLRQSESLEYEVVGRPCNEMHNYVCDFKVTLDSLQPE
ncbi:uncharacterized protein LOC126983371 isoform X3 [Eriocheir sinensis]|uniref:uncharacterized protein LOC126983371 isoform X3 n=1 Tax=Eriocheir sinensis TaxID=95602 RepID=UPI0021C9130E|nr:uncharacterized protein LOC126983371 isoform X3 [Eriocheir sinensis]